jgi:hypothetical protein
LKTALQQLPQLHWSGNLRLMGCCCLLVLLAAGAGAVRAAAFRHLQLVLLD